MVVCEDNLAGCDWARKNFATHPNKTNGIVVISDEDGQPIESSTWIPTALLNPPIHVKESICGGDRYQLLSLVSSTFQKPGFDKFSPQLTRPKYDQILGSQSLPC